LFEVEWYKEADGHLFNDNVECDRSVSQLKALGGAKVYFKLAHERGKGVFDFLFLFGAKVECFEVNFH